MAPSFVFFHTKTRAILRDTFPFYLLASLQNAYTIREFRKLYNGSKNNYDIITYVKKFFYKVYGVTNQCHVICTFSDAPVFSRRTTLLS